MSRAIIPTLIKRYCDYDVTSEDVAFIDYAYKVVEQSILNSINRQNLPSELENIVELRTVGEFINSRKDKILGDDDLEVTKSVKIGDTKVDFGGVSKEERLTMLADSLINRGKRDIACYRKLKW